MTLPDHLADLVQPTPSGTAKLLAAWDGLSVESHMQLLNAIFPPNSRPGYHQFGILNKALSSPNAYIRYLAARQVKNTYNDEAQLKKVVEADPDLLVRHALLEQTGAVFLASDPSMFFALPHEARLAKVRLLTDHGRTIATLIAYAVDYMLPTAQVSERELHELLTDYLGKTSFIERYVAHSNFVDYYDLSRDIEALWRLVPKVPSEVTYVLLQHLPEKVGPYGCIPQDVLDGMDGHQLQTLFWRADIGLAEFRREKFFVVESDVQKSYADNDLYYAAVSCLDISNADFSRVLSQPEEIRVKMFEALSMAANNLRLCVYQAVHDELIYSKCDEYFFFSRVERGREERLTQLTGHKRERELLELKLYHLAKAVVDDGGCSLHGYLAFMAPYVEPGRIWATFCKFVDAWERHGNKHAMRRLPILWEIENSSAYDEEDVNPDPIPDKTRQANYWN